MGFLGGSWSYTRLRVLDHLPDDWRDRVEEGIARNRFVEQMAARSGEPIAGWVKVDDIGNSPGNLNDWSFQSAVALGIRIDGKRVNGKLLKVKIAEAVNHVMTERGLERIGAQHRREIAEAVKEDLLARALPTVKAVELVWEKSTGSVLLFAKDDATIDIAQALFIETAGSRLYPFRLVDWLGGPSGWTWDEIEAHAWALTGAAQPGLPLPEPERYIEDPLARDAQRLAQEFLLWLWFKTEHDFGSFNLSDGPADVWIDDRMTFDTVEEKRTTNAFTGGAPSTTPEAKLSILSGKGIRSMRVGIRRGDVEWSCMLVTSAAGFRLDAVKAPVVCRDGLDEMIFERLALLDQLHGMVGELFRRFVADRASAWPEEKLKAWLHGEDESVPPIAPAKALNGERRL